MTPMRALRANPHFAHLFERVHPLCWPILWWSLNRLLDWYESSGYEEVLYETNCWGFIRIAYCGDRKPDPSACRPYVLERPRWDDACWATNVPVCILTTTTLRLDPNPPMRSGGGGGLRSLRRSRQTEGASALTPHNTS
ncbi:hypothetical protein [Hyphomonas sp.]|uniref:hypothetical protein n=1 Tax=Hyphomonas sp. TaxID=87 RepID=UPI00391BAE21